MQKYQNNVTGRSGDAVAGAYVQVNLAGTATKATIYSDAGVTPKANPMTTDGNGYFEFYVADGYYDILINGQLAYSDLPIVDVLVLTGEVIEARDEALPAAAAAINAKTAAQAARDTAVPAAATATTQAGIATSAAGAAATAQTGAETARAGAEGARDAALIQSGVYVDEPTGRAAVADGVAFKVQGTGDVAAYEYRRVNSGSSTLIATYPSKAVVDGARNTAGERYPYIAPSSGTAAGVTLVSVGGKVVGWTITDTNKGNGAYVTAFMPLSTAERTRLVGKTVRLRLVADATAGYLAAKPFTTNTVQAVRTGTGLADNVGTLVRNEQVGAKIYREFDYIVTATDLQFGIVSQISGTAGTSGAWSFQVSSVTYSVVTSDNSTSPSDMGVASLLDALRLTTLPAVTDADRSTAAAGVADGKLWSLPITTYRWDAEAFNGAALRTSGNPAIVLGVTIPAASTGQTSYESYKVAMGDFPAGTRLRLVTDLKTSDNFRSTLNGVGVTIRGSQGTEQEVAASTSATQVSTNRLRLQGDYITQGSIKEIMGLQMQLGSSIDTSGVRFWEHEATYLQVVSSPDVRSANSVADTSRSTETGDVDYVMTVTVAPSGGDYSTLTSALAAVAGRSLRKRALVQVLEGTYATLNGVVGSFVDVVGVGQRDRIWIKGELADNVDPAQTGANQTLWVNETSRLINLKITCRNMRYAIHSDSGASDKKAQMEFRDSYIEHLGNDGAIAYQTGIGGNPGGVWAAVSALGCGTHSGQRILSRNTWWQAKSKAFYFHDSVNWTADCSVEIDGGAVVGTSVSGYSCDVKYLGSMRKTIFRIRPGTIIRGPINIDDKTSTTQGWLNTALACQPANRMQGEVILDGSGAGSGISWTSVQTNCACLELRSISDPASSVAVSGDAAVVLFGALPDVHAGCVGLAARMYSQFAITSDVNASVGLGTRLGDCSTVNKTLGIVFDAGVNATLTLAADYTAMTNAQVVTALNALLAAAGGGPRSFFVSTPYDERAVVRKPDLELQVKNTDTTAILRGQGVAINIRTGEVALMTGATAAADFAGVALEDIAVGGFGRAHRAVKGVQISQSHLVLSGVAPALGVTIGPGATAGAFSSGGVAVLRCVETGRTSKPFTVWEFI